ncbi:hypothetical protein [Hymenobacter canadensis]|uniref:Uncharacterized protein n=1 Tax=Hymenobacter canadensis TaxID=2999067 RepID=A0ABY7LLH4_9BACT|nr:hypothetical protein [Hymenobacter canadensis]WBA40752.1 hypothetical protein O3303_13080 [Hymenobacter canadensis]
MPFSLSAAKNRTICFTQKWPGATQEQAEALGIDLFTGSGATCRRVATCDEPVQKRFG